MSESSPKEVVAHWHKLIENFQTTSLGFYASVEDALERRKIPGLQTSRVDWNEGGVLSPRREYLRVTGERHSFDMCAAPFGTGFFFSSWVTQRKARWVLLYMVFFAVLTVTVWQILRALIGAAWQGSPGFFSALLRLGLGSPIVLIPLAFIVVLWLIAQTARAGFTDGEAAILAVPLVGWFYGRIFAPETYYRIDTMLMFQSAVHSAMLEVIDEVTTQKGVRGLSEDERKPVFYKLM